MKAKKPKQIILVGDLVTHLLYARDWLGLIVSLKEDPSSLGRTHCEQALVHMVPGSTYEFFFRKRFDSESTRSGWISTRWLLKIEN